MKKIILLPALTAILFGCPAGATAQGIMTTVAGNGTHGTGGDGGLAIMAQMAQPSDVCIDKAGNLYIAEFDNASVRKVDAATSIISTVYVDTFSLFLHHVCVDTIGNIYFATTSNWIKKIDATSHMVTIIAGDTTGVGGYSGDGIPAFNAKLNNPCGLATDLAGNLYIADFGNSRIRKINASTGIITTIAGNGTRGFGGDGGPATASTLFCPLAISLDKAGNIFFSDDSNYVVRKISAGTGIITSIAGTQGTIGFGGDGGPATNAIIGDITGLCVDDTGNVYIDDYSCSCRKISAATGLINRIAGFTDTSGYNGDGGCATQSLMNSLEGVCINPVTGNLYIADQNNDRIRMITQTGGSCPTEVNASPVLYAPEIFPNPASNTFIIKTSAENMDLEMRNLEGQTVYSEKLHGFQSSIDISDLAPGVYCVIVSNATERRLLKISICR